MVQRRLGRGLDYLISGEGSQPPDERVLRLPLRDVRPNPYQPRRTFSAAELDELAASIEAHGVIQPVIVRRAAVGYELVAGERRYRACHRLGRETLPAVVRAATDNEMLELALVENLQREALNPIETAQAYGALIERLGLTQEQAAARVGKSRSAVANTLRLLELPENLQERVASGLLSAGHARALLSLADAHRQFAIARRVEKEGLSVRDVERLVQARERDGKPEKGSSPAAEAGSAHFEDLEGQLREALGTRVRITGGGKKGRIAIEYYTAEDLDRLVGVLLGG